MTAGGGELKPQDTRFGTTRGSLANFLLSPSWNYRLVELRNLSMNETDVLTVALPEWLKFLYPVMRLPLWICRNFGLLRKAPQQPNANAFGTKV